MLAGFGNKGRSESRDDLPFLFHATHGSHVRLSENKRRAARKVDKHDKGICFSHRPVYVGELISLRITGVSIGKNGVLRFGFTKHDPAKTKSSALPRSVLPDFTRKSGYWAKEVPPVFAQNGIILSFCLMSNGDLMIIVNGVDNGSLFGSVDTNCPLWAVVDLYGNTTSVDIFDARQTDNIRLPTYTTSISLPGGSISPAHSGNGGLDYSSGAVRNRDMNREGRRHHADHKHVVIPQAIAPRRIVTSAPVTAVPPPQEQRPPPASIVHYTPLSFHATTGSSISLSGDQSVAERRPDGVVNGYVFTERQIACGETITVEVLSIDEQLNNGGLTFGITTCDPANMTAEDMPDDPDLLLDRPEYWIVNKDICMMPQVGDKFCFHLTLEGEVQYHKNGHKNGTLMCIDHTLDVWMFFDVCGTARAIRLCGIVDRVTSPPPPERQLSRVEVSAAPPVDQHDPDECKVCMERRVNCVLTPCGHVVLCYECATDIKNSDNDSCPICRRKIEIITKMYRA